MRDYWLTQYLLAAVGWGYVIATLVAIALVLWLPKRWWHKLIALVIVVGVFSVLPRQAQKEVEQAQVEADAFKLRQAKAQALFDERCKTAGEKIYRTVENVDGVLLMKGRTRVDKYAQFDPNDPAGDDAHDAGYIESFLMGRISDVQQTALNTKDAYRYVEMVEPSDQNRYRYLGKPTPRAASPHISRHPTA